MTGILLEDKSVLYKGANMTIVCHHSDGNKFIIQKATRVDCDGEVVAIHYYDLKHEIKSVFYELNNDPSRPAISHYEVTT